MARLAGEDLPRQQELPSTAEEEEALAFNQVIGGDSVDSICLRLQLREPGHPSTRATGRDDPGPPGAGGVSQLLLS